MEEAGIAAEPVTLGVDEYFVLGDNLEQQQGQPFRGCGSCAWKGFCRKSMDQDLAF